MKNWLVKWANNWEMKGWWQLQFAALNKPGKSCCVIQMLIFKSYCKTTSIKTHSNVQGKAELQSHYLQLCH